MNLDKTNNMFWKLANRLRNILGYYNLFSNVVHLMFLEYLITFSERFECLGVESFKAILTFKRKLENARLDYEPITFNDISDLMRTLDSEHIFKDLQLSNTIRTYEELFRKTDKQSEITRILDDLDLIYSTGYLRDFFDYLVQILYRDAGKTGEFATDKSLRELAVSLLEISSNDSILNCFAGYSTLALSLQDCGSYWGFEIDPNAFAVSKMMLELIGFKNYKLFLQDFMRFDGNMYFDKVFANGPLNVRYDGRENFNNQLISDIYTRDGNVLILAKVLNSIAPGGKAVVAVPARVLFSGQQGYQRIRSQYVNAGLRAVISLPPLWFGTKINTNLLYIEKGYRGPIEFVDATRIGTVDSRRNYTIQKEDINNIKQAISKNINEPGFAQSVDSNDVLVRGTWQPSFYIPIKNENNVRNLNDIDAELNQLYKQLKDNLK